MGLVGMSKGIALDMQRFNVRSNCIAPFAMTPMVMAGVPNKTDEDKARWRVIERMKPENIALFTCALLSDQAKDISGQIFGVRANEIYLFSQHGRCAPRMPERRAGAPRRLSGQFWESDRFGTSGTLWQRWALSSRGANELSAPLPDLADGAGTATGLSPPLGATFTPFSSRVIGGGLVAAGVEPFGVATRCPFITARTSLIARVCSRGDLSMLIWSILRVPAHVDIGERAVKARPRAHVGVFPLGQIHQAANVRGS